MNPQPEKDQRPHVIIVGAGFGGLRAARELANAPVRVTLIDRNNYHLFQPLLYQVATAGVAPDEIAYPVRAIFRRQKNLDFRMCEVEAVDLAQRSLRTSSGDLAYDYLILAVGGTTNYFGLDSLAQHSFGLKELGDATRIRNHLLGQFERASQESDPDRRRAMLTFVIVGGGPSGVESAGAISELVRMLLHKDYPALNPSDVRVVLLEAFDRLLAHMPPALSQTTADVLARKRVEVHFGAAVAGYDGQRVTLKSGEVLPAETVIWTAGVRAARLVDGLGLPQAGLGRVRVEPGLQAPGHPEVFIIGDAAYLEGEDGKPLGMIAPVAMQQAAHAAANLRRLLRGEPAQPFVYHDPGIMATIGRNQAVVKLGSLQFTGFPAWVVWLVVHLMQLVGFRNRLQVLINWAWDYFFYERAIRLIEGPRSGA